MLYRTSRISGYGYKYATELTEVLCRVIPGVIPGVNTPGTVCEYPTEHGLGKISHNVGAHIMASILFFRFKATTRQFV